MEKYVSLRLHILCPSINTLPRDTVLYAFVCSKMCVILWHCVFNWRVICQFDSPCCASEQVRSGLIFSQRIWWVRERYHFPLSFPLEPCVCSPYYYFLLIEIAELNFVQFIYTASMYTLCMCSWLIINRSRKPSASTYTQYVALIVLLS